MKILNLKSELTKKDEYLKAFILPRCSGKTTSIVKCMKKGDVCISPFQEAYYKYKKLKGDVPRHSYFINFLVVEDRYFLFSRSMEKIDILLQNHKPSNIFIDEFQFFADNDMFFKVIFSTLVNHHKILLGSSLRGPCRFPVYYYDKIIYNNLINIPDKFFTL